MKNINLIRQVAWSFHRSTGVDWDELFQEAAVAYYTALRHYNLQRNGIMRGRMGGIKATTFLYRYMQQHLISYLQRERYKWNGNIVSLEEAAGVPTAENDFTQQLSRDAQRIARVALRSHRTFDAMAPEQARRRLAQVMLTRGWTWRRIWCAVQDIKLALK